MASSEVPAPHTSSNSRSTPRRLGRFLIVVAVFGTLGGFGSLWIAHRWIENNSRGRIYRDLSTIPSRDVALVLGTAKLLHDGRENLYFTFRTDAAAKLYHAGKVAHLLVSGDNGSRGYDEPTDMRDRLVELGVPASDVTCDFAGFRTLDSIVRAKEIFGLDSFLIVSDAFHIDRALFLADKKGVRDALGFASRDVGGTSGKRVKARELLARAKAVADIYLLRTKPKFLGKKEPIIL